ncbi:hypothetical protein Tco_0694087 [Tanacetum coccineum]
MDNTLQIILRDGPKIILGYTLAIPSVLVSTRKQLAIGLLCVAVSILKEEGIDFDDSFAQVARIEASEYSLPMRQTKNCSSFQMDVKAAFLETVIFKKEVFAKPTKKHFEAIKVYFGYLKGNHSDGIMRDVKIQEEVRRKCSVSGRIDWFSWFPSNETWKHGNINYRAEYIACLDVVLKILWMRIQLKDTDLTQ